MFGFLKIRKKEKLKKVIQKFLENTNKNAIVEMLKKELANKNEKEILEIVLNIEKGVNKQIEVLEEIETQEKKGKSYEGILTAEIIDTIEKSGVNKEEAKEKLNEIIDVNSNINSYIINEVGKNYYVNNEFNSVEEKEKFSNTLKQVASTISIDKITGYINSIKNTIDNGNEAMKSVIYTNTGCINQNSNLDGFIAEQKLVNSFNIDASVKKSEIFSLVPDLKPKMGYSKNGFDVIMKNGEGKNIHQYQVKYGATDKDTIKLLKNGNYNNQTIIVPSDQVKGVQKAFPNKTVISNLSHDSIKGKGYTKQEMKKIQLEVQQGNVGIMNNSFKNDVNIYSLSKQVAKQSFTAGFSASLLSMASTLINDKIQGRDTDANQMLEKALITGRDIEISTAIGAALKVGVENGYITGVAAKYLNDTSIGVVASSSLGIMSTCYKVGTGEISLIKGLNNIGKQLTSSFTSIKSFQWAYNFAKSKLVKYLGGMMLPMGNVINVASVVMGAATSMISTKAAEAIYDGGTKIVSSLYNGTVNTIKKGVEGVKSLAKGSTSLIGNFLKKGTSVVKSVVGNAVRGLSKVASSIGSFFGF
ncbi:hypothetical protein [Streptobacillus canis]|uniref:hypothetical protein n=1 Tax=Streptobacillus canis TaxID=2678686 RepID=UPI0012E2D6B9|nr:hypothetical protein [Streptobacillus canis]